MCIINKIIKSIKKDSFKKEYFKYSNTYDEELTKYLEGVKKRNGIYYLDKEDFLKILLEETKCNKEKLKKFFLNLKNPLADLDEVAELRGIYLTCFDNCNNLTIGKSYKKIKKSINWHIGSGVTIYTIKNDLGIEQEVPFYYFIK